MDNYWINLVFARVKIFNHMGNEVSSSTSSSTTASTLPLRSTLHGLSTGNDVGKLLGHNARNKRILITVCKIR